MIEKVGLLGEEACNDLEHSDMLTFFAAFYTSVCSC